MATSRADNPTVANATSATGLTSGPCPGYIRDHILPLVWGGPYAVSNMQWQAIREAWETKGVLDKR